MKKSLLKCSLLLMALGVAFVSCNDDISSQDVPDGYVPGEYHYSLCIYIKFSGKILHSFLYFLKCIVHSYFKFLF